MKILHTSDWHLGRTFHGVDLLDAQTAALDHLVDTAIGAGVDLVLVSGDVYDRAIPPAAALALFDTTVVRLLDAGIEVLATSGNHDSFMRLGMGRKVTDSAGLHLRTRLSDLTWPVLGEGVAVYGIPYLEPGLVHERFGTPRTHSAVLAHAMDLITAHHAAHHAEKALVVAAHAFVAGSVGSESERDLDVGGLGVVPASVFESADYAALGHVHSPQKVRDTVRYSGSLLPYSFGESSTSKAVTLVESTTEGRLRITDVDLPAFVPVATVRGELDGVLASARDYAGTLVSVELTDEVRVPDALPRLRAAFDRLVKFRWLVEAERSPARTTDVEGRIPTDSELFDSFFDQVAGHAATPRQRRAFADALSAALTEEA